MTCLHTGDAAGNATLYRNGVETKSGFNTSLPTNVRRTQNSIGNSPLNDYFPGILDDLRIYNRALCVDEVSSVYSLGRPRNLRIVKWKEVK